MKKILCMLMALTIVVSFAACGDKTESTQKDNPSAMQDGQTQDQNGDSQGNMQTGSGTEQNGGTQGNAGTSRVTQYDEHDIRFDVPEAWQDNFQAIYQEIGSGDTAYTTITFTCRIGQDDVTVMTIAAFGESQWETIKASSADAESMQIGTSKDGKTHYTLRIEEQKFENEADQKTFDAIREAAESLQGKITITK